MHDRMVNTSTACDASDKYHGWLHLWLWYISLFIHLLFLLDFVLWRSLFSVFSRLLKFLFLLINLLVQGILKTGLSLLLFEQQHLVWLLLLGFLLLIVFGHLIVLVSFWVLRRFGLLLYIRPPLIKSLIESPLCIPLLDLFRHLLCELTIPKDGQTNAWTKKTEKET